MLVRLSKLHVHSSKNMVIDCVSMHASHGTTTCKFMEKNGVTLDQITFIQFTQLYEFQLNKKRDYQVKSVCEIGKKRSSPLILLLQTGVDLLGMHRSHRKMAIQLYCVNMTRDNYVNSLQTFFHDQEVISTRYSYRLPTCVFL